MASGIPLPAVTPTSVCENPRKEQDFASGSALSLLAGSSPTEPFDLSVCLQTQHLEAVSKSV